VRRERPRSRANAEQSDELASPHELPQPEDRTLPHRCRECRVVHHSKIDRRMAEMGQERRIGAVRNISALPPRADLGADIVEPPVSANYGSECLTQSRKGISIRSLGRRAPVLYRVS
jgi:hypothetical protein